MSSGPILSAGRRLPAYSEIIDSPYEVSSKLVNLPPVTPDLVSLDLLLSVAEYGSLGQAGRGHEMSQPAVSRRMAQRERRVISALAATDETSAGRVVQIPTTDIDLSRKVQAVWPRGRALSEPAQRLLRVARVAARNVR
jgi:DNA-binding transcriptional LysR family regulator